MEYRIEHDTMGEVRVPAGHFWGAQTQRSLENFRIGTETVPEEVIRAFAILKMACARANHQLGKLDRERTEAIAGACQDILDGKLEGRATDMFGKSVVEYDLGFCTMLCE